MKNHKEAKPQAQIDQFNIDNDVPYELRLGKKKYKVKYLKDWVGNRISLEIAKKNKHLLSEESTIDETLNSIQHTGNLTSKVLSLAILGSWWKIKLFHWFLWRKITHTTTKEEQKQALEFLDDKLQVSFFFLNMILIERMNQLRMKLTKVEAEQYRAELVSEQKATS